MSTLKYIPGTIFYLWESDTYKEIIPEQELEEVYLTYLMSQGHPRPSEASLVEFKDKLSEMRPMNIGGNNTLTELKFACNQVYGDHVIKSYTIRDDELHVVYETFDGTRGGIMPESKMLGTAKTLQGGCLHPNKYYNVITQNLAFWVCPDCKQEVSP